MSASFLMSWRQPQSSNWIGEFCYSTHSSGDAVALWVEHRTSHWEVAGSTPAWPLLLNNFRQVVHTLVPLSSRYWSKNWEGNGRLWKKCGLPPITLSVSLLPAQGHGNRDELWTRMLQNGDRAMLTQGSPYLTLLQIVQNTNKLAFTGSHCELCISIL